MINWPHIYFFAFLGGAALSLMYTPIFQKIAEKVPQESGVMSSLSVATTGFEATETQSKIKAGSEIGAGLYFRH